MLASRYLDGSMDALELLLCSEPCSQPAPVQHPKDVPQHQLQPSSPRTCETPGASSADAGDYVQAALEQRERRPVIVSAPHAEAEGDSGSESSDTGTVSRPGDPDVREPCGVPRRHASELSYDDFVLQYMAPNLPVMIQVSTTSARWPQNGAYLPTEHACVLGQAGILLDLPGLRAA